MSELPRMRNVTEGIWEQDRASQSKKSYLSHFTTRIILGLSACKMNPLLLEDFLWPLLFLWLIDRGEEEDIEREREREKPAVYYFTCMKLVPYKRGLGA